MQISRSGDPAVRESPESLSSENILDPEHIICPATGVRMAEYIFCHVGLIVKIFRFQN